MHQAAIRVACVYDTANLNTFERETGPRQHDLLILPELCDGGYARLHRDKGPMPGASEIASRFEALSGRLGLHCVAGSVAWRHRDGAVRNTSLVFSRGAQAAVISKTHLFRPLGDDQFFAPGIPGPILQLDIAGRMVRTAVIICYDLRFPEIVRPWFKEGLDLLLVPARWPRVRDGLWHALLRARAIENQCFVIGVNARDDEGGGSYGFGPDGTEVFRIGPDPTPADDTWSSFEINLAAIHEVKSRLDTRIDARLL